MIAVIQRVSEAAVRIEGEVSGEIGAGFMILLGIGKNDNETGADWLAGKIAGMRLFADEAGKMNLSLGSNSLFGKKAGLQYRYFA